MLTPRTTPLDNNSQTFDRMIEMRIRPGQESLHMVMMTFAGTGNLQKCEWGLIDLINMKYFPNTTTINIVLAGHLYSSAAFNEQNFMRCYNKHFVTGDLVPDRFTYTQLLLACEKINNVYDAANHFNNFLKTELRITVAMKNALLNAMGDEYPKYVSTLSEKHRQLLDSVEVVEHSMKQEVLKIVPSKDVSALSYVKKKVYNIDAGDQATRKIYVPKK